MDGSDKIGTVYYFGDPMCSWCWGLKPVLEQVDREYPELRRVTVMGGLRAEPPQPMSDEQAARIQHAWLRIERSTGQAFNHELWRRCRPLATTLPACRAVVTARLIDTTREWPYMVGMFKAYFTEARDPSRRETHLDVAAANGFDRDQFAAAMESPASEEALRNDLLTTQRYGITGFPSVVLELNGQNYLISPGYQPIDGIRRAINSVYQAAGVDFTRPENGLYS
ncbi:MAG: DsbA family protein [Candidatus Lambdaproteobacteria bacterium]|nr:DsbA family protein [Candidatus Lambdaproteobacteria bacterium]